MNYNYLKNNNKKGKNLKYLYIMANQELEKHIKSTKIMNKYIDMYIVLPDYGSMDMINNKHY